MPDYAVSQTVASAQFDRFLLPARMASLIEEISLLFTTNIVYTRQDGGWKAAGGLRLLSQWALVGVDLSNLTLNTDGSGQLWVRITANAGNWDIHVYKAVAAASEVMTATNVAAGATATLAAANSSGMSGTVVLASANMAAVAADTYALQVYVGFGQIVRQIFNGLHQEDAAIATAFLAGITKAGADLEAILTRLANLAKGADLVKQLGRIWVIPSETLGFITKSATPDNGTITVTVDGILERFRQNWAANTTVQKVPVTTLAAGAASYASSNQGVSTATVGTLGENLEPGTIQGVCTRSGPGDQTEFTVTFTPTDGTGPKKGRNVLTVGKTWDDPDIPCPISLAFSYLLANDDGDGTDVAAVSQITGITGLTNDNSDGGKLYGTVVASGSAFIYKFYKASGRTAADLVAQSPAVAAATAFTATTQNQSGVTVGWKSGSAPADGDLFDVNQRAHKAGDSTHAPDSFTIAITRSALGWVQDLFRRYYDWKVNSGGSPTFADSFGQRGSLLFNGGLSG